MNHNGALFNLDNLYLTFKIVFHYDHLVSIKLFRGWKVEKKNRNKKFGGVIIRHIDRLFFGLFRLISLKFKSLMYRNYIAKT